MAKGIASFVEGKIRRSETQASLQLDPSAREDDPELGAFECRLASVAGATDFFARGLILADGARIPYDAIARVMLSPVSESGDERLVDVLLTGGSVKRIRCTDAGGVVLHATLRWIGRAILRRVLD